MDWTRRGLYVVVFSVVPVLITSDFATVKNVQEWVRCSHPRLAGWSGMYCINTICSFCFSSSSWTCDYSLWTEEKLCTFTNCDFSHRLVVTMTFDSYSYELVCNSNTKSQCHMWLAVWLSGNALVSINVVASVNVVAVRQTRLVPGWVTVCERVNNLGV